MTRRRPARRATSMACAVPLSGWMRPKKSRWSPGAGCSREGVDVDAVVDGGRVVQARVAVGVADGHVGRRRVVALVDGHDARRREAVDGGHDRGVDQAAVGERQEVEAVVDDVEVAGAARTPTAMCRHSATLGSMSSSSDHPCARRWPCSAAVVTESAGGEQRHVVAQRHQTLGEQRGEQLPRSVVAGRGAPGDRREHGDPQRAAVRRARCAGASEQRDATGGPDEAGPGRVALHPLGRVASLGLDGRIGFVALRRLDASTEPMSGARRCAPRTLCGRPRRAPGTARFVLRHPVHASRPRPAASPRSPPPWPPGSWPTATRSTWCAAAPPPAWRTRWSLRRARRTHRRPARRGRRRARTAPTWPSSSTSTASTTAPDGDDVLRVLDGAARAADRGGPHRPVRHPTAHQRSVLRAGLRRRRRRRGDDRERRTAACSTASTSTPAKVVDHPPRRRHPAGRRPRRRRPRPRDAPRLLTWGLLGPGKGIEWAIDAVASLERPPSPPQLRDRRRHPPEGAGPAPARPTARC